MPVGANTISVYKTFASEGASFRRAFIFDPGLGGVTGHWLAFSSRLLCEFNGRGIETRLYGNINADDKLLDGLEVHPLFRHLPWHTFVQDPDRNLESQIDEFFNDLARLDATEFNCWDLLIFPSLFPGQLGGLMRWLNLHRAGLKACVALVFQFSEGTNVFGADNSNVHRFRQAINLSADLSQFPTVRCFASSVPLAHRYSIITGIQVYGLPMPAVYDPIVNPVIHEGSKYTERINVGYFGHASLEKGAHFLDAIVHRARVRLPMVRFILHANPNPDTLRILEGLRDSQPENAVLHWGHLRESAMRALMNDTDILLMPYDAQKYEALPSMVFCEAMLAGKIVVTAEGTWMAREAYRLGASVVLFDDFNADSVFLALQKAVEGCRDLADRALVTAGIWRSHHNVGNFVSGLLKPGVWASTCESELGWSGR